MTTFYRVRNGRHAEPVPGTQSGEHVVIEQGGIFKSENDWYDEKWPEKFERIDEGQVNYLRSRGAAIIIPTPANVTHPGYRGQFSDVGGAAGQPTPQPAALSPTQPRAPADFNRPSDRPQPSSPNRPESNLSGIPQSQTPPTVQQPPNPQFSPQTNLPQRQEHGQFQGQPSGQGQTFSDTNQPPSSPPGHEQRGERFQLSDLDKMSVKELQAVAAEEEIDLKGATRKEDIVRTLKSNLTGQKEGGK